MAKLTAENWMTSDVIVLNATYEPLERAPATRAIVMLEEGLAETVESHDPIFLVRSQFLTFELPKMVRMLNYVHIKHHVVVNENSKATAVGILRRDHSKCGYCGEFASTIDHILPQSRGGENTWGNLISACKTCNEYKADRTPEEAGMLLLWPPKVPSYDAKLMKQIWRTIKSSAVA